MKQLLLITTLFMCNIVLYAEELGYWDNVTQIDGYSIRNVARIGGEDIVGFADKGTTPYILISHSLGSNWRLDKAKSLPPNSGFGAKGITIKDTLITYVGYQKADYILKSTDLGDTWSKIQLPGTAHINCINMGYKRTNSTQYYPSGMIMLAGKEGIIYKSNDFGETWEEIDSGTKNNITDIEIVNDSTWIYTSFDNDIVCRTDNSGKTWDIVYEPTHPSQINCVYYFDKSNIISIGCLRDSKIILSDDSGLNWKEMDLSEYKVTDNYEAITATYFRSMCSGFVGTWAGNIYFTADSGKTWTCQQQPDVEYAPSYSQFMIWDFIESTMLLCSMSEIQYFNDMFAAGNYYSYSYHTYQKDVKEDNHPLLTLNPNITNTGELVQLSDSPISVQKIDIYSVEGKLISSNRYKAFFNAPEFQGLYFVNITLGNGSVIMKKLLVK